MQPAALRFTIPTFLLLAGCSEVPAPAAPFAPPHVPDPALGQRCVCSEGPPQAWNEEPFGAASAGDTHALNDAADLEELRVCHLALRHPRPAFALQLMSMYEQHHPVKHRKRWETVRTHVRVRLDPEQQAAAGVQVSMGSEPGEDAPHQDKLEMRARSRPK